MNTLPVSRRQVLTLAGLTLGAGVIEFAGMTDPATAAPTDILVLQPIPDEPVGVLSGDGAAPVALPRQLAVQVLRSVDLPAGVQIAITFDPRVYAPLTSAVLVHDGRAVAADRTSVADPGTGLHTTTITLTETVPGIGTLVAVVGTAHPLLYPYDLVRRPPVPTAGVRPDRRASESRWPLQPQRPPSFGGPTRPWGIEVDGVWSPRSWGENGRYRYHVPVRVTLRSVGPAPTPAATSFAVTLDPRLVRSVTVAAARLNHKPYGKRISLVGQGRTGSSYQTRWRVPAGLAPGDVLDLNLTVATTVPAGPLVGVTHPLVAFVPVGEDAGQRYTGRQTLTRTDAVCGEAASG